RQQRDDHRVVEPAPEAGGLEQFGEVVEAETLRDQRRRTQGAPRVERGGNHEQDGEDREGQRDDAEQVSPADPLEPVAPRTAQADRAVLVRGRILTLDVLEPRRDDRFFAHTAALPWHLAGSVATKRPPA